MKLKLPGGHHHNLNSLLNTKENKTLLFEAIYGLPTKNRGRGYTGVVYNYTTSSPVLSLIASPSYCMYMLSHFNSNKVSYVVRVINDYLIMYI